MPKLDDAGYLYRELADGRQIYLFDLAFGNKRISIGAGLSIDDNW